MEDKIIKLYNAGHSDWIIASNCGVSLRTIQRKLKKLREAGILEYRYNLIKIKDDDEYNISKFDLNKLLALYKTRTEVAKKLGVTPKVVSRLCAEYNIEDLKTKALKLNEILKELTKDYKPARIKKKHKLDSETLVIDLGDWHVGKVVKDETGKITYNIDIAKERIGKLIEAILKLLDSHLSKHIKIEEAIIILGGDLANGEDIYPTQAYDQEVAPPKQVMIAVELLMSLIKALLDRGISIEVYGVKGNHGRLGKDADPASNWDLMIYMILGHLKTVLKLDKLEVRFTEADYLTFVVRNKWTYLIKHEAPKQDETPAGKVKYLAWEKEYEADLTISHHFHHWDADGRRIVNGSPVGKDDLSERMACFDGNPCQLLWVATDERSHTNIYPVDLKKVRKNIR